MPLMTPEAIASYPNLFEPRPNMNNGDLEYSMAMVFEPGADLSVLENAALAAAKEKFGAKAEDMFNKGQLRHPLRDGEEKYGAGYMFMNVKTKTKPQVVSRYAGPDGKPAAITNPEEIYPGAKVRATVNAYAYSVNGNKGVSFYLNNVQKLGEGERIDGRMAASSEFDALESAPADMDGTSDLDDLMG